MAAEYEYEAFVVYNAATGAIAKNASGYFLAQLGGDPASIYDMNASPIVELTSNSDAVGAPFRADVAHGYAKFGDIIIPVKSTTLINLAEAAAGLAALAEQAAANAASAAAAAQSALTQLQAIVDAGGVGGGLDVTSLEQRLGGAPGATQGLIPKLPVVRIKGSNGVWPPKSGIGGAIDLAIGTAPGPTDQDANGDTFIEVAL